DERRAGEFRPFDVVERVAVGRWPLESKKHENSVASVWKTGNLSSYAQAQVGSELFALVESIRGG
ncbi:MAG: hypothetical protein WCA05_08880, partial [Pseudolabrys sp.]